MRDKLLATIQEHHSGKIWWSGKSRVRVGPQHLLMLDKKAGGRAVPLSRLLQEDLERMVYELDRGINVEKDSVAKGQALKRIG